MTDPEIYSQLTEIMCDVFDDDAIVATPQTSARDIAGWDSQAHITLIVATEARFGVRFRTAEVDGLGTIGDLVRLITAKTAARQAQR